MTPNDFYVQPFGNILQGSYTAGDVLAAELEEKGFDPNGPVLSASFVNNDNLEASSSLGRLLSEQISSRLVQHGINVKEVKLRKSTLYVRHQEGEFMLSREIKNLGLDFDAQAALVGTYSVTPLRIFLTTKIVRTLDNTVIASHDYTLAQNAITRELVR
ncbi:MAG: FlgO family outer membrane protein [Desulfovermiculus sp.]